MLLKWTFDVLVVEVVEEVVVDVDVEVVVLGGPTSQAHCTVG
jgi:hypothetical protein